MTESNVHPLPIEAYDASDEAQVTKRKLTAKQREHQNRKVISQTMATGEGRAWMYDQLKFCHIFEQSFDPNNPHTTSFNEGARSYGNKLLAEVSTTSPHGYLLMMRENAGR